jgi:hypothetical protein
MQDEVCEFMDVLSLNLKYPARAAGLGNELHGYACRNYRQLARASKPGIESIASFGAADVAGAGTPPPELPPPSMV